MLAFNFLNFSFYGCLVAFIFVCLFLILLILIQKGRGGGLSSAFGGAGGNTAFGSKTGDVLTWATSIVFGIFLVLAVVLNLIANSMDANQRKAAQNIAVLPPSGPAPISAPTMPPGAAEDQGPAAPTPAPAPAPTPQK
jgi:preprotein translocase subunit SecG